MKAPTALPAENPINASPCPVPKQPPCILVVDDDSQIRWLCARILTRQGYHVDIVEDGGIAWDTLQLNRYDLLLTDNDMPKVSGVELIRKVYAARMSLPIVLVTGNFPASEFILHPWLQPTATLLKPYTNSQLVGIVKEALRTGGRIYEPNAP